MDIIKTLYCWNQLKKLKRTGWINAGIAEPESIADHTTCAALIGWILADMEGADSNKVVKMLLLHDIPEARIGDLTIVNKTYVKADYDRAMRDMLSPLPAKSAKELLDLWTEFEEKKTLESRVAHDADKLDMYLEARVHEDVGYSKKIAEEWKKDAFRRFTTKSAKKIAKESEKVPYASWWDFIYRRK